MGKTECSLSPETRSPVGYRQVTVSDAADSGQESDGSTIEIYASSATPTDSFG